MKKHMMEKGTEKNFHFFVLMNLKEGGWGGGLSITEQVLDLSSTCQTHRNPSNGGSSHHCRGRHRQIDPPGFAVSPT